MVLFKGIFHNTRQIVLHFGVIYVTQRHVAAHVHDLLAHLHLQPARLNEARLVSLTDVASDIHVLLAVTILR